MKRGLDEENIKENMNSFSLFFFFFFFFYMKTFFMQVFAALHVDSSELKEQF
jgi:hypothetical protein